MGKVREETLQNLKKVKKRNGSKFYTVSYRKRMRVLITSYFSAYMAILSTAIPISISNRVYLIGRMEVKLKLDEGSSPDQSHNFSNLTFWIFKGFDGENNSYLLTMKHPVLG